MGWAFLLQSGFPGTSSLFLASFFSFLLSQVPVPQANFMEDIEKWLSTDVVSEGLLSWSQQSCQSCCRAGFQAVYNSAGTAECVAQAAWREQGRKSQGQRVWDSTPV